MPRSKNTLREYRQATNPRSKAWFGFFGSSVLVTAGSISVTDIGGAIPSHFRLDATIIRMRGELLIMQDDAPVTETPIIWAAGIIVANEDAVSVGATALPDPGVDDADWMWHRAGYLGTRVTAAAVETEAVPRYIEIDNKSMRKMNESFKTLALVFSNSATSGESTRIGISIRMLVLLK